MSIDFTEYLSCLKADADHPHTQALGASYHEAARVMSPRRLEHSLTGIKAMCGLNKGADLVLTYVQEMPRVAKEVGEDIIPEVVSALMKLGSHTYGTVVALIMSSMPLAASRLGDADVLRGYLNLTASVVGQVAAWSAADDGSDAAPGARPAGSRLCRWTCADRRHRRCLPRRTGRAPARQPHQLERRRRLLQPGHQDRRAAQPAHPRELADPLPRRQSLCPGLRREPLPEPRCRLSPRLATAGPQVRLGHRDGQRGRCRDRRRRRAGDLGLRHRVLSLQGRGHLLQRDGGQGACLGPLSLSGVGLPGPTLPPGLGDPHRTPSGPWRPGAHGRDPRQAQAGREPHTTSDRRPPTARHRAPARLRGGRGAGSQRRGAGHDRRAPRHHAGSADQHPHHASGSGSCHPGAHGPVGIDQREGRRQERRSRLQRGPEHPESYPGGHRPAGLGDRRHRRPLRRARLRLGRPTRCPILPLQGLRSSLRRQRQVTHGRHEGRALHANRRSAAQRHAGRHLTRQPAQKRLVLVITDGEPADIDERDPQYLRHDSKKAVEELRMQGIHSYCLTLDPQADRYVARIFGENQYSIVDHVERLPERLPAVFAALTG